MANTRKLVTIKTTPFPTKLQRAAELWLKYTENIRKCRADMLNHYANGWYKGGDTGVREVMPINLIDRGVQTLGPFLVSQNPKVSITTKMGNTNPNAKSFAWTLELALNHLFEEIAFGDNTLRPVAIDSLFCMGITKTGVSHAYDVEIGDNNTAVGQPYCDRIDFDDYVGDVTARTRAEMKIEGHFYELPLEYVIDSGLFKHYGNLVPNEKVHEDKTRDYVKNRAGEAFELWPTVTLLDLYIPKEGIIVTLPPMGYGQKIMRTVEWDGPDTGPFDVLAYRYYPNSCVPIPPVYTWLDLNKAVNVIVTKMRTMTEREKTIGIFDSSNPEDAEKTKNAAHGDLIGLTGGASTVKEITYGGFNGQSLPFLQWLLMQYSQSGPNMDLIRGAGNQSPTLGQDQMLQNNALREVDDMVGKVYEFTKSTTKKLAWFLWTDPLKVIPVIKRVAGIDLKTEYSEATKEGDFFDYGFDIEPYSLGRMNPELRYQKIMQLIGQVVLPTAEMAMAQGNTLNVSGLVEETAKYLNVDTTNWWIPVVPPSVEQSPFPPTQGTPEAGGTTFGQGDDRGGATPASKQANKNQFDMSSRAGKPSPPNKSGGE